MRVRPAKVVALGCMLASFSASTAESSDAKIADDDATRRQLQAVIVNVSDYPSTCTMCGGDCFHCDAACGMRGNCGFESGTDHPGPHEYLCQTLQKVGHGVQLFVPLQELHFLFTTSRRTDTERRRHGEIRLPRESDRDDGRRIDLGRRLHSSHAAQKRLCVFVSSPL